MTDSSPYILGIGGTTRAGSSTESALRYALRAAQSHGARTLCVAGDVLTNLPLYAPESAERHPLARRLIQELRRCDGVIIASPGYHGSISGLVKNALDYAEDLRTDDRVYLTGLPVGVIATASGWQAIGSTLAAMRSIVHALRAWPTPLGVGINTCRPVFNDSGDCVVETFASQLQRMSEDITEFTRTKSFSSNGADEPVLLSQLG